MKKVLAIFVAAVVGVTSTFAVSSSAFADDVSMSQEQFIEKADEFVEVTDDGLIELELPDKLVDAIEPEEYEQIMEGIAAINEAVESGELAVTSNGTIYETEDEELVVQGGNVNKITLNWWGVRIWLDHDNAKYFANQMSKVGEWTTSLSYRLGLVSGASAFVSKTAGAILFGLSGLAGLFGVYFTRLGRNINYYNGYKGVIIDITWVFVYQVKSQ